MNLAASASVKEWEKFMQNSFYKVISDVPCNVTASKLSADKIRFDFQWDNPAGKIEILFSIPCTGIEGVWEPTCLMNRNYNLHGFESTAMGAVPLIAYYNNLGNSIFAIALSDSVNRMKYKFAINERTAEMDCRITIDLEQFGTKKNYSITIYTQNGEMPIYEMCDNVSKWWDSIYDNSDLMIPDVVKTPCYSTWYAYHNDFTAEAIISECRKAKEFGLDMVIVDDGWQADDPTAEMKYKFTGEYKPSKAKIPDMKKFVADIHHIGMKFLLWYSIPFMGYECPLYDKFKDKILKKADRMYAAILDPRYPEVREHVINLYVNALKDWNLDGFKLDFIDNFRQYDLCEFKEGMDYYSIHDAVERLLNDAITKLRAIKKDIIIEFRQGYVGPNMARYATINRVVDCPENYRFNRVGITDLRMLNKKTVTHSDMLMYNKNDSPEVAALQILNSIFGVIQFSVKFDLMSDEQKKMTKFWLDFAKKHRELLTETQIKPQEVNNFYPVIRTENASESMTAVYEADKIVSFDLRKMNYIINASGSERLILETKQDLAGEFAVYDCMGNLVNSGSLVLSKGIHILPVSKSGLLIIKQ